jgi:diaminohydroxyphosphoribosylaminopyrimidine deaminase/5-amino-6-(5-phosphoribosylamino)uracil reductase
MPRRDPGFFYGHDLSGHPGAERSVKTDTDRSYMERALNLAGKGRGRTSPNPMVGAIIVDNDEIVGSGYHERFGGPHAEVNALAEAGDRARGATIYVTLEPCCIWGNTPPCTDAIIDAGIARVVVPVEDPNPAVAGNGIRRLRDAGVTVDFGLMREQAESLNAPYRKFRRSGLPWVVLKLAMSLDGRITGPEGKGRWVSSEASRERVHAMRSETDCVMIGVGTVLADDPQLTDRRSGAGSKQPTRLVLDSHLRTPLSSALVQGADGIETILACGEDADRSREEALAERGVAVWRCRSGPDGLDLRDVLNHAAAHGKIDILAEGGAQVASSLLRLGLADRLAFFVAPDFYGDSGLPAFPDLDDAWWEREKRFTEVQWSRVGRDALLEARLLAAGEEAARLPRNGTDAAQDVRRREENACSPDS